MAGLTLDAGALIAFERNDRQMVRRLTTAIDHDLELVVPAGVVGQVWRNGRTQARLGYLLAMRELEIEPLDDERARAAGRLCGVTNTADAIDGSVVLSARRCGHQIVTSDPEDLARLDPRARLIVV